jgi:hypothetical protein
MFPITTLTVHIIKKEEETVDALLALQLYCTPSSSVVTTDTSTDNKGSSLATTDDSLSTLFKPLFDHLGEGWIPNLPNNPHIYHFELPAMYKGVITKYIQYNLSPASPLVLAP